MRWTRPTTERRGAPRWVFMLAVAGALWGCTASSPSTPSETDLLGSWRWLSATGGVAGVERTPQSEGYEETLLFTPDGKVTLFRDGQTVATTGYTLTIGAPGGSWAGHPILRYEVPFGGFEEQAVSFPEPGVLELADGCCDGFVYRYAREGEG